MGIYTIPVIGWVVGFVMQVSAAIPLYIAWNAVAPIYFGRWLYPEWLNIPFWHMVGLIVSVSIIKGVVLPSFSNTTLNRDSKTKE